MAIIFNGTGYIDFPALGLTLNDTTGWTVVMKMKYVGNAGNRREILLDIGSQSQAANFLEMFIGQTSVAEPWTANRINVRGISNEFTEGNFNAPDNTPFDTNIDAVGVYFVSKSGSNYYAGRCMPNATVTGRVVAAAAGTFNLTNIPMRIGLNKWVQTERVIGAGREIHEFGIINRGLTQAEIESYASGTAFSVIAAGNMLAYADFNEGSGTTTILQRAGTTSLSGTLVGGLTWGASQILPVAFNGTVPTFNRTVGIAASIDLSTYFTGNQTPFTYTLVAGSLSGTGLSLNASTGVISGTPTSSGNIAGLQVRATDSANNTATTNTFSIGVAAPALPAGTVTIGTITVGQTTATVPFTYSAADFTGYQYRLNGGSPIAATASPINLTGLTDDTNYTIEIRAVNGVGNGGWSSVSNFKTEWAPKPPQGVFTFGALEISSNQVIIPYTYSLTDQTKIQYRVNSGTIRDASISPQTIVGLTPLTAYSVEFRAVNATGNGNWSAPVNFTTTASVDGAIVLTDLVNNVGQPLANTSNVTVDVYSLSTGGLVARKTALTTTPGADLTVSDAAIVAGNTYTVVITIGTAVGITRATAT